MIKEAGGEINIFRCFIDGLDFVFIMFTIFIYRIQWDKIYGHILRALQLKIKF
jgi:hypothetical protein